MSTLAIGQVAAGGLPAHLTQLDEAANEYVHAGVARNTRRAFEGALRSFESWCASAGVAFSPADVETVRRYLAARAPQLAASTLALHLVALNSACRAKGWPEPGLHPQVKALMKGVRSKRGKPPNKKRGLLASDLKRALKRLPSSQVGLRDRAILLVGFAAVLRRSELAALAVARGGIAASGYEVLAVFVSEGLEIHVNRAKGDQEGRGAVLAIPFGREVCPVAALRTWLDAVAITDGPAFRAIDRHGNVGGGQLSDRSIARIVKAAAGSIGLDASHFSGHSLRRGGITSMHRGGAAAADLQRHSRHADFRVTAEYIEAADRFATSAARFSGL